MREFGVLALVGETSAYLIREMEILLKRLSNDLIAFFDEFYADTAVDQDNHAWDKRSLNNVRNTFVPKTDFFVSHLLFQSPMYTRTDFYLSRMANGLRHPKLISASILDKYQKSNL